MLKRFINNESGATAVEYSLIAAFIAISIIASAEFVGDEMIRIFFNNAKMPSASITGLDADIPALCRDFVNHSRI